MDELEEARDPRYTRLWSALPHLRDRSPSRPTSLVFHFLLVSLHCLLTAAYTGVGATQMNSLTYLTRQFDVLASPRTPPSTPTSESPPSLAGEDQHGAHKRPRSWSTRSFHVPFPGSSSPRTWTLKRSLSSPADVNPAVSADIIHYPSRRPSTSQHTTKPPSRRPSVSSTEKAIRPKRTSGAVLRSIFFVRIILLLWHAICAAWRSLARQGAVRTAHEVAVEDGTEDDEKDSEDESKDAKSVLLDVSQRPYPPAIPPPLPASPSLPPTSIPPEPIFPTVDPSLSDIPPPQDNSDPEAQSHPPSAVAHPSLSSISQNLSTASRSSTPSAATYKAPFHLPKTLVLDLDETLIHSTSRPMMYASAGGSGLLGLSIFGRNKGAGHVVEVVLGGRSTLYHVYKRPFVDYFLRKVSGWYTLVIFTASMQEYADPVIDWLDAGRGILTRRLFRESCTQLPNGSYTKDLSIVEADLARVCLIDNSPICYNVNEANGIPIEGWTHDPHDEALLDLLPVLDSLRFTKDVRRVLGIRGFS